MINKFDILLPIKTTFNEDNCDFIRFKNILLPSLRKNLNSSNINKFFLVVNDRYYERVKKEILNLKCIFDYKVLPDSFFIDTKIKCDGWVKQQLIKILFSQVTRCELYFVIDSDLILVNKFDFLNINCPVSFQALDKVKYNENNHWWFASYKILFPEESKDLIFKYSNPRMGITPQFFYKDTCLKLIKHLKNIFNNENYLETLIKLRQKQPWTEFSLYWIFLSNSSNKDEKYKLSEINFYEGFFDYSKRVDLGKFINTTKIINHYNSIKNKFYFYCMSSKLVNNTEANFLANKLFLNK